MKNRPAHKREIRGGNWIVMLVLLRGLPGSGKSALARALSPLMPAVVLDKDDVRAALFPGDTVEYTSAQDDFVIRLMLAACDYHLDRGRSVILDGRTHALREQVDLVVNHARNRGTPIRILECVCTVETAIARVTEDTAHRAKNRDADLVLAQAAKWQAIPYPALRIDTEAPLGDCVAQALTYLRAAAISSEL